MKVIVHQLKKNILVKSVCVCCQGKVLEVHVDTDAKYPTHTVGTLLGGGKPTSFEIYLYKSSRCRKYGAIIELIPTTKREIKMFNDCSYACVTSRFGPLYTFYSNIDSKAKLYYKSNE